MRCFRDASGRAFLLYHTKPPLFLQGHWHTGIPPLVQHMLLLRKPSQKSHKSQAGNHLNISVLGFLKHFPPCLWSQQCGSRNVGLPLVCRRWAWTSPRSAPGRVWAASALAGTRISGCCDKCRWRRRARLWPGEWWHLAPGCTGFPFYSSPWNPCNLVQKGKRNPIRNEASHRVEHIPGSTQSV